MSAIVPWWDRVSQGECWEIRGIKVSLKDVLDCLCMLPLYRASFDSW
jgi:hypothetical protein